MVLLNPAMNRKADLQKPLAKAQTERDAAVARAAELESAKARYESDYREMVKLVRAIPQSVRVADLMRELSNAADGTGIQFNNITMGADEQRPPPVALTPRPSPTRRPWTGSTPSPCS